MINFDALSERVKGNKVLVDKILNMFLEQYDGKPDMFRDPHSKNDHESLFHLAHTLKGTVSMFCGEEDVSLIAGIEQTARDGANPSDDDITALENLLTSMFVEIKNYLNG